MVVEVLEGSDPVGGIGWSIGWITWNRRNAGGQMQIDADAADVGEWASARATRTDSSSSRVLVLENVIML